MLEPNSSTFLDSIALDSTALDSTALDSTALDSQPVDVTLLMQHQRCPDGIGPTLVD
jgi:hypothetical protein